MNNWRSNPSHSIINGGRLNTFLLLVLVVFASGVVAVQARDILIPITLAWLLSTLLSPLVFLARRYHVPIPLSSAVILLLLILAVAGLVSAVADPASRWLKEVPTQLEYLRKSVTDWTQPIADLKGIEKSISDMAEVDNDKVEPIAIDVEEVTWLESILINDVPVILYSVLIIVVLSYLLLLSQERMARSAIQWTDSLYRRKQIIRTVRAIRTELSLYLLTISIINFLLGLVVALALYGLGMPNPVFWGMLAGLLNYAPYIGAVLFVCLLFLGALSAFSDITTAVTVCSVYVLINVIEAYIVTPTVIGRRLALSPVAVFLSVILWTWLWGAAGALLAAPLLACFKIIYEKIFALESVRQPG